LGALGRAVVGHMGRKLGGHYVKAVAEHFNRVPVAITQGIKKVEEKFRHENDFRQAIEKIEKMLTNKRKKKYLFTYAWYSDPIYFLTSFLCLEIRHYIWNLLFPAI
jgi:hypothetical protein